MERLIQTLPDLLSQLSLLETEWEDDTARRTIDLLRAFPAKDFYTLQDISDVLEQDFSNGLLMFRLFLGVSEDQMTDALMLGLGGSIGVNRFKADRSTFLQQLEKMGLLDKVNALTDRECTWVDILVERLRSGRGSAIGGQKRGRALEDFAESVILRVFGRDFESRCKFVGAGGMEAKCDFAIPSRHEPRILIEVKGYGATGSKMSDVLGDLNAIVKAKRQDTTLIFFTDGVTWRRRQQDLAKIIQLQQSGAIARIYTRAMAEDFRKTLEVLKREHSL